MFEFIKRLFRSKDHWLHEYLKDQVDPIIEINGEAIPNPTGRRTEEEFKQQIEAATQTLPTGLSFAELNAGRVAIGDLPHAVAGVPGVSKTQGVGDDGKLPTIDRLLGV